MNYIFNVNLYFIGYKKENESYHQTDRLYFLLIIERFLGKKFDRQILSELYRRNLEIYSSL